MWFEFDGNLFDLSAVCLIHATTYTKPIGNGYVYGDEYRLNRRSDPLPKIILRRKDGGEMYLFPGSLGERDAVMKYLKELLGAHSMATDYDKPSNVGAEDPTWSAKLLDPAAQG